MNRSRVFWVFVAVVAGVFGGWAVNYATSFRTINIRLGQSNMQVGVYKHVPGMNTAAQKPLFNLDTSSSKKLRKGAYDFILDDPSGQYANPDIKVTVDDFTDTVTIDSAFSKQKLATMLQSEDSTIRQAILTNFPMLPSLYTISSEQLYEHGEWYGAALTPIAPGIDKNVFIMKQGGNGWEIAAKPQISIGIPSNPSIPTDVIDSVDQL